MPNQRKPPAWLWAAPVFSFGLLAPIGPFAIAVKSRARRDWLVTAVSSLITFFTLTLASAFHTNGFLDNLAALLYFANIPGSIAYAMSRASELHWGPKPVQGFAQPMPLPPAPDKNQVAIASARAMQQKRNEALEIVKRDPHLARELRIGRPDLPRQYDDGGLVDINGVPPGVYVHLLGLSQEQSAQIVAAREYLGSFQHTDDLTNLAGLDLHAYDKIKHKLIAL